MDIAEKRAHEQMLMKKMIRIYCKGNKHKGEGELCEECAELLVYANMRVERCPHMEQKTFCSNCKTHCFKPDMRERVKKVMRFSGPRLLLHNPILVIKHAYYQQKDKKRADR